MAEHIPELLAPAGSYEAAMAALCNGADAIYLGAAAFGARASAGFSQQELKQVIDLYHFYGRRVYVTVNTLVKQRELDGVRDTLRMLSDLRADAVLVQDLGVLSLIAREFPHLCVHASTQMALHNVAGARLARSLGMRRVVLARECTLDAIRAVADTGVETEVFVHGAQCVCVSGQCRYSGLIGGRSGNRGRCAQPCRLPYTWQGDTRAWLSPRDLCLRDQVKALAEAGVCSLKIEGRLKRPEYVAVVTRAYRGALDALRAGRFAPADAAEREALSQVFSRTFFPGYAFGVRDAQVMNPQRVSSAGVDIGTVQRVSRKGDVWLAQVQLSKTLHNGDGLQLRGAREQDIIYSGPETPAGSLATLRLHHPAQTGDAAVRIDDEAQLSAARASYQASALPRIAFDAQLAAQPGQPAVLTVQDDRAQATVSDEIVQSAQNAPLDEDRARRALGKTGDTAYILRDLTVTGENAYLPAAALNAPGGPLSACPYAACAGECAAAAVCPGNRSRPVQCAAGKRRGSGDLCAAGYYRACLLADALSAAGRGLGGAACAVDGRGAASPDRAACRARAARMRRERRTTACLPAADDGGGGRAGLERSGQ